MKFKRFLRHKHSSNFFLILMLVGIASLIFFQTTTFKFMGLIVACLGLVFMVLSATEFERVFWRSQLEWWDEDDNNFETWQKGEL